MTYCLLAISVVQINISAQAKSSVSSERIDENSLKISISIPLENQQYIYADLVQFTTNTPNVTLSSWQSSVTPIVRYDPIFKENRRIIGQSTHLTLTASRNKSTDSQDALIRLIYYTNTSKTPIEELFTISFSAQQAAGNTIENSSTAKTIQETPDKQNQLDSSRPRDQKKISWFDYLKNIAQASNLLWVRLLIALLLGLLLSLTPCIYPMIPITIGILQAQSAPSLLRNFSLSLAYTFGIATTFALLGLAASMAGHAFGSFMAHPIVILLIVALMVYSALSLFGLYEIRMPRFLQRSSSAKGGSFVSAYIFGVISGTVASPCLSPGLLFMLTLVATLKSVMAGFMLLFSFGIGLSIPLLIIGTFSSSINLLPRAGYWMIEIKYLLGFMLLGMCFYFVSSIVPLTVLYILFALFLFVMGIFYMYHARCTSGLWYYLSTLLGMLTIGCAVFALAKATQSYFLPAASTKATVPWVNDYQQALKKAQQQNSKVVVFIHAPKCSSCIELEEKLNASKQFQAVASKHILLTIDLAKKDNASTQAITKNFNILGAPTVLIINPADQQVIHRWDGEVNEEQFNEMITLL